MFNTSESTATGRKGSFGLKLGALVAASSLMLAGGVAVATSVYAAPNDNANSQGKKPDKDNGNSSNAPGQQSADGPGGDTTNNPNGGAIGGDNGGNNNPQGPGSNQNGSDLNGGTGNVPVNICHATRSASNPYVFITVDFSSIDEAMLWLNGGKVPGVGNGHGDHVGGIWDGQRSGVNWGDIISAVTDKAGKVYYPGYNLDAYSEALGADGRYLVANGCQGPKPVAASLCVKSTGGTEQFPGGVNSEEYKAALASGLYSASTPCGPVAQLCVIATGLAEDFADGVESDAYKAAVAQTDVYSTTFPCTAGGTATVTRTGSAFMEAPLCHVDGEQYARSTESQTVTDGVGVSDPYKIGDAGALANAEAQAQERANSDAKGKASAAVVAKLVDHANNHRNDIIPPFEGVSKNWSDEGQLIYRDDCQLPDGETVQSINLAAPATIAGPAAKPASGNPAPGTVPVPAAGTPLPGSVPAGDGSSLPGLPVWALALLAVGAIGAAASGVSLATSRKG
jgi:hypothetical protein